MDDNETLMFECIQERDIDLLLMEEWCVNADFAKFFLGKILSAKFDISDRTAWHSITDDAYGESDVVLTFHSGEQRIAVLVEDKIDAAPQPDQAKRYQLRADKMKSSGEFDQIYICIVAPEHYLKNDTEEYPNRISYETLADFLGDGTPRGEYKANMLRHITGETASQTGKKRARNQLLAKISRCAEGDVLRCHYAISKTCSYKFRLADDSFPGVSPQDAHRSQNGSGQS